MDRDAGVYDIHNDSTEAQRTFKNNSQQSVPSYNVPIVYPSGTYTNVGNELTTLA